LDVCNVTKFQYSLLSGGLLWTRWWTFGFLTRREVWPSHRQAASQEWAYFSSLCWEDRLDSAGRWRWRWLQVQCSEDDFIP